MHALGEVANDPVPRLEDRGEVARPRRRGRQAELLPAEGVTKMPRGGQLTGGLDAVPRRVLHRGKELEGLAEEAAPMPLQKLTARCSEASPLSASLTGALAAVSAADHARSEGLSHHSDRGGAQGGRRPRVGGCRTHHPESDTDQAGSLGR